MEDQSAEMALWVAIVTATQAVIVALVQAWVQVRRRRRR